MNLYSWQPIPGLIPMLWLYHGQGDAIDAAAKLAPLLKQRPSGQRVVLLHTDELRALYPQPITPDFVAFGPDTYELRSWSYTFFIELKRLGAEIDLVVCDFEKYLSTFDLLGKSGAASTSDDDRLALAWMIMSHPAVRQNWNTARNTSPEDFVRPHYTDPSWETTFAIKTWNREAATKQAAMLDDVIFAPLRSMYPESRRLNYGHCNFMRGFQPQDANAWPIPDVAVPISSPVLYFQQGNLLRQGTKPWQWRALVNHRNTLLACADKIIPWVHVASASGDVPTETRAAMLAYWSALMQLLAALNVKDAIHFNPPPNPHQTEDDLYVLQTVAQLESIRPVPRSSIDRSPLPLDADVVSVGAYQIRFDSLS